MSNKEWLTREELAEKARRAAAFEERAEPAGFHVAGRPPATVRSVVTSMGTHLGTAGIATSNTAATEFQRMGAVGRALTFVVTTPDVARAPESEPPPTSHR